VIETPRPQPVSKRIGPPQKASTVITFMGAKGGVGTTTVALNTASALARRSHAILVELRPALGTLSFYFRPPNRTLTIAHLLEIESTVVATRQAEACLWSYEKIPGLRLLFGPQAIEQCREISPAHAKAILATLARLADYVIVDIPTSLGETNRAVIEDSSRLVLVVERDPICVQTAKLMLPWIGASNPALELTGAVVVNRAALATPMPIPEIEAQLGVPALKVIPPAPDLCMAAQKVGSPAVLFDPESLIAGSFAELAEHLALAPGRLRATASRMQMDNRMETTKASAKILVHASKDVPQEMVSQYLLQCRNDLPPLKAALARCEYEFARVFGHQMKGCGGAYGFPELTEAGALIERAAADQNIGELRNRVAALEAYLGRIEVAFEENTESRRP
jgi:MinD-like ATPase involved in chromosome partitioning or flagellar assembly/HPt (histidine-containing phosphotransfer) domain-containing protein